MNCLQTRLLVALSVGFILSSDANAVEPLRTNGASFRIPFAVDQLNSGGTGTAILFASKDGAAMEPVQRVAASERSFHFLAPSDGQFQFAVRMMDAQGKMIGEDGPLVPELEVVVDSKPPGILLELAETASGQAVLKWAFSEQDIARETLKIEYLESGTGIWKSAISGDQAASASLNQTTIRSNPGQSVAVRASVKDLAGNVGSGTGQIVLSRQQSRPGATSGHSQNGAVQSSNREFLPFEPSGSGGSRPGALNIPSGQSPTILGTSPFSLSDEEPRREVKPNPVAAYGQNNAAPISMDQIRNSNVDRLSIPLQPKQPKEGIGAANPYRSASMGPAMGQQNARDQGLVIGGTLVDGEGFTTESKTDYGYGGLQRQHLNNRLFDLAYEIDSVGPSGVGMVVLYVTENNGRNWFRYGEDKDLKSPLKIDTRGEGTFGFAVRVHNGVGFSDPPPQPGEVPSVVVTVDQTPPALRMATPELATQGQGTIRLKWDIQEANPADAAVRLEYASLPEGPWSPVFDWQPDPSGYEMPVDRSLPPALHFRLLARDKAGNVSTTQTAQPVLIDRKRPKARVLSVKPASATPGY